VSRKRSNKRRGQRSDFLQNLGVGCAALDEIKATSPLLEANDLPAPCHDKPGKCLACNGLVFVSALMGHNYSDVNSQNFEAERQRA